MPDLNELYQELARLRKLPITASQQAILRVQQQIAVELKKQDKPVKAVEDISSTIGGKIASPALTDTGDFSMVALQKRQLQKFTDLNAMDFSTSAKQDTGNTSLASIYGASSSINLFAANIYGAATTRNGYLATIAGITQPVTNTQLRATPVPMQAGAPSSSFVVSQIDEATIPDLITSVNTYLAGSTYKLYSIQMFKDTDFYMVITEFNSGA